MVSRKGRDGRGRGCKRDAALIRKIKLLFLESRLIIIIIPRSGSHKFNKLEINKDNGDFQNFNWIYVKDSLTT